MDVFVQRFPTDFLYSLMNINRHLYPEVMDPARCLFLPRGVGVDEGRPVTGVVSLDAGQVTLLSGSVPAEMKET